MGFFEFAFSFLYTRNWHTGKRELSQSRVAIFGGMLFLIVLALIIITVLQAPVDVQAPSRV